MTTPDFGALTHRDAPWGDLRVLVAGIGVSGFAAADALAQRGARVLVVDAATPAPGTTPYERARILEILDVEVRESQGRRVDPMVLKGLLLAVEGLSNAFLAEAVEGKIDRPRAERVMLRIMGSTLALDGGPLPPMPLARETPPPPADAK